MAQNKNLAIIKSLIVNNLNEQRKTGKFCDIKLVFGKKKIYVHSAVMCAVSSCVNNAYCNSKKVNNFREKKNGYLSTVKIKIGGELAGDCYECLEKLINFIYGQEIYVQNDHTSHVITYCELLAISDAFMKVIIEAVNLKTSDDSETPKGWNGQSDVFIKSEPLEDNTKLSEYCKEINSSEPLLSEDEFHIDSEETYQDEYDSKFEKAELQDDNAYLKLPTGKIKNCIGCSFKCYRTIDLLGHLRQTGHGGNVCSLCWSELDSSEELGQHFLLHEHPKPFFCSHCNLRFRTRSLLGQHLPRHLFEKPYICPHCQKAFKRKHGLNCHLITHSSEKKHLCDECGFSTTHARILRAHKLTHSGDLFKCSFLGCSHTSTRKENMKQHLATHNNEKPFVCELCGHKFTQSKSLKRHSMIHSKGEMDNICPHCPFKSRRIDNLKAHILRQHTEKPPKSELTHNYSESIMIEPDVEDIMGPMNALGNQKRRRK